MEIGKFITIEGIDGSGKTTQCEFLCASLLKSGIKITRTREPGGTKGSELIRTILVEGEKDKWDSITETLLHVAARRDHVEKVIKPSLNSGKWVICDRFYDSTLAYQGYGHGVDLKFIKNLNKEILGDLKPDLTLIFDISFNQVVKRTKLQPAKTEDRYEKMGKSFQAKVAKGFLEIAKSEPKRCAVINAINSQEKIHSDIIRVINERFKKEIIKPIDCQW